MVYAASICTDLESLWCSFKPYLCPLHHFKFSKAANLFVISIWYCLLTSSLFSFLKLNLSPSNFCAIVYLLPIFPKQLRPPDSYQYHSQLPWNFIHLVYSNAISYLSMWLIRLCLPIRRGTWMFRCMNTMLLISRFFDVTKFTHLTPLSFLSWCRHSFPIVGLKIFSLPTLALKSPNRIFIWYLWKR